MKSRSMSDTIVSSITSKMKLRSLFFAVNTRNMFDELTSDLAGDFSIAVSVDVDPNKNVNLSEEMFKLHNRCFKRKSLQKSSLPRRYNCFRPNVYNHSFGCSRGGVQIVVSTAIPSHQDWF